MPRRQNSIVWQLCAVSLNESQVPRHLVKHCSECLCRMFCCLAAQLSPTSPWTAARQAPPSTVFSRQEYWSGLPFPSPVRCLSEVNCPPLMWVDFIQSVEYLNRTKKLHYRERLLPVYLSRNIGPLLPSDLNWSISSSWVLSLPYIWTNLHYHLSGVSRCLTVDLGTSHLFKSILFL